MSQNIAIVGAGICGMITGLALANQGHTITLFERDTPPPEGGADRAFTDWPRKGAAQFRHPHAFLSLMCNLLEDNYPDLLEDFYKAGARRYEFSEMMEPALMAEYTPKAGDEKLWVLMCRRATMETVLRRYVGRRANIRIINDCNITGFISDANPPDTLTLQGISYEKDGQEQQYIADVVVDASGRTTKFPAWFKELGATVKEEKNESEIVYYTRHYQFNPGVAEPVRNGKDNPHGDLGYIKFGVFPAENGHFAVILCVPLGEQSLRKAVRNADSFDAIVCSIPGLKPWLTADKMTATTDSFGMAGIQAQWRYYVNDGTPLAHNFFAVGDAAVRTNPMYGRGCSLGILHAHILADVISNVADPRQRALEFDRRSEDQVRPLYKMSTDEDKRGIERALSVASGVSLEKPDSLKKWFFLALEDALGAAVKHELNVYRGVMRTFHLLEKPGEFLRSRSIQLTVLRYMLRGRSKNAAERMVSGPSRDEMLTLIDGLESSQTG